MFFSYTFGVLYWSCFQYNILFIKFSIVLGWQGQTVITFIFSSSRNLEICSEGPIFAKLYKTINSMEFFLPFQYLKHVCISKDGQVTASEENLPSVDFRFTINFPMSKPSPLTYLFYVVLFMICICNQSTTIDEVFCPEPRCYSPFI